jgi:hypothetical protein
LGNELRVEAGGGELIDIPIRDVVIRAFHAVGAGALLDDGRGGTKPG